MSSYRFDFDELATVITDTGRAAADELGDRMAGAASGTQGAARRLGTFGRCAVVLAVAGIVAGCLLAVARRRRAAAEREADLERDRTLAASFPASDPPEAGAPGI